MPEGEPAKEMGELYEALSNQFEGMPVIPVGEARHSFNMKLERFMDTPDSVRMMGDDFPYFRSALVDEAIARGDVKEKPRAMWADNATLTINGQELSITADDTINIHESTN